GDGTSSSQVNPNHIYTQPGTYTVCLRIQKRDSIGTLTNCVRETCNTIVVQSPQTCNLVANFYAYPDSAATVSNTYQFVNTSAPLNNSDSIRWTFGDGTASNQLNPVHSYTQPGTYTVCLIIQKRDTTGTLTNCIREICHQVTVMPVCNIQSNFSWRADSLNNRRIYFTNQSFSPTAGATATWSFGDGTSSTAWNPVHEYAQPGLYYVCLKVQLSATCFSYSCDTVTVQATLPNCNQQSNFSFSRSNSNTLLFSFSPAYTNSNWQYTWTFGDGTGSHDISPYHQYALAGNYTVCLTVFRNAGCASTTCRNVTALTPVNCNNINVSYNYQRDPVVTNKLYFQAVSNYTIVSQTWTIKKMATTPGTATVTLLQNNPSYVFQDTGMYRVCLRAVTLGGCIKEYCREIYIQQLFTPSNCNLQVYPNPVTSLLNLNIYLTQPQMLDVYIYNSQNVLVREKHQQGFTGTNIVTVPVANLVAGSYTVKVIRGNSVCYAQFVKL
nr:PKD domain-containing protein [Ferruginibacter sp.]